MKRKRECKREWEEENERVRRVGGCGGGWRGRRRALVCRRAMVEGCASPLPMLRHSQWEIRDHHLLRIPFLVFVD